MKSFRFILITTIFLFLFQSLKSQTVQDTSLVQIQTIDGNEFVGEIVGQDSLKIYLKTEYLGEIGILKKNIRVQKKIESNQLKEGKYWFTNPQSSRYFWAPNGYGLRKGEGNYQNIYVFWNQASIGITENFSIGGGIIPLFLLGGEATPVFITPKFSIPVVKDKFNIGLGALAGTVLGESGLGFGIVYGISTFGTRDKNLTFGLGYGYSGGEWASTPLINISGLVRLSPRGYFITENYLISSGDESFGVIGVGGRWIIKKASLDFIFVIPVVPENDLLIVIPLLGFSIPFGTNN